MAGSFPRRQPIGARTFRGFLQRAFLVAALRDPVDGALLCQDSEPRGPRRPHLPALMGLLIAAAIGSPAAAQSVDVAGVAPGETAPVQSESDQRWAVHGQTTFVLQGTPGFPSPYSGRNSLAPDQ